MRFHMPLGGPELEAAVRATPAVRPFLIEGLVLEETSMLMVALPGQGKTSVLHTMVLHASNGLPVFGHLACARPLRFYIFCPERRAIEIRERLRKALDIGIPVNFHNIYVDDGMTGVAEFCGPAQDIFNGIDHAIKHRFKGEKPDIFCVEGLHGMSSKALVDPEFARGLLAFNANIHARYKASLWYSSHAKKPQRNYKGEWLETDYLGGILIPAIMTGYYLFERLKPEGEHKSHMTQRKDTVSGLCNELAFIYDPETDLLRLDSNSPQVKAREKFRLFINSCLRENRAFTHAQLMVVGGVSQSTVSREICQRLKEGAIINTSAPGANGLYKVLKLI